MSQTLKLPGQVNSNESRTRTAAQHTNRSSLQPNSAFKINIKKPVSPRASKQRPMSGQSRASKVSAAPVHGKIYENEQ